MAKKANFRLMAVAVMVVLIGTGSAWADLTDGLIAHWKLDGDANDSAGSNDGTLVNGPTWTTGQIGGALDFDGADDYVDMGDPVDGSLDFMANESFSISVWFKLSQDIPYVSIIDKRKWIDAPVYGYYKEGYDLVVFQNKLRFGIEDTSNNGAGIIGSTEVNDNKWHHVIVIRDTDSDKFYMYLDGISDATPTTDSTVGSLETSWPFNIARKKYADAGPEYVYFPGLVDDVRVYDRALSAEEVAELSHGELLGLDITGPDEVAENSQAQYKAIADYELASDVDVTNSAIWSVEPNDIANIDAIGLLTTQPIDLPTDVTITAQYSEGDVNKTAEKQVSIFAICPSGSALEFDGVDDYIQVPYSEAFQLPVLTVTAWIYPTSDLSVSGGEIVGRGEDKVTDRSAFRINVRTTTSPWGHGVGVGYEVNNDDDYTYSTDYYPLVGQWTHIAVMRDATGQLSIYANSILIGQWNSTPTPASNCYQDLTIGASWSNESGNMFLSGFFPGTIDEVAIFNRALSAEEVQALMHTRPDTDEPNLVAYWDFDEGEGQVAGDSASGNDGQLGSTSGVDNSDPNWVDSDVPVGVCTMEELFERNINQAINLKLDMLDILEEALGKETAGQYLLEQFLNDGNSNVWKKRDILESKRMVRSAVQNEEKAEINIDQSIDKLDNALNTLGIE